MATYKVIQDIEAEDKLLGPLSLRQFIYAVIVVVLCFIMFRLFVIQPLLILPLLPPAIFFAVLAAPFGHDQSSEVWLLAKIRFFLKPRVRIWDQSGLQELVTITAPKHIEQVLTNGLDEYQVKSRLQALAQTIDTRGWAVKGVDVNLYTNPAYIANQQQSDRLLAPQVVAPVQVADVSITATDDMLDTTNNPIAQHMDQLVRESDEAHRQQIAQRMQQARTPAPTQSAYTNPTHPQIPAMPVPPTPQFVPQITAADEQALLTKIHAQDNQDLAYGHTRVLQTQPPKPVSPPPTVVAPPVTAPTNPDILKLANNDDLSVATIARQINKKDQPGDDEVVISLR